MDDRQETIKGPEPGDIVAHIWCNDVRAKVIHVDDGHCQVQILAWKGSVPTWLVTIPTKRLFVIRN